MEWFLYDNSRRPERVKQNLAQVITLVAEWIETYGIHHSKIFRSSYKESLRMRFEPTTTEFRLDAQIV